MLPSGAAGKNYTEEVTRLIKLWINDTPLKEISGDTTLRLLKQKHRQSREPPPEVPTEGPIRKIHPIVYYDIDESLILKASMLTKGG